MSSFIVRKGWKLAIGPPSWTFRHQSGWEVRTSEDAKDIRPYKLFAPDGSPVKIVPYNGGFVKRCQAMAIAEFFARNPLVFESLQNHVKRLPRSNHESPGKSAGTSDLALGGNHQQGEAIPGSGS